MTVVRLLQRLVSSISFFSLAGTGAEVAVLLEEQALKEVDRPKVDLVSAVVVNYIKDIASIFNILLWFR